MPAQPTRTPPDTAHTQAGADEWIRTYEHGHEYIESLGGIDWAAVRLPPRWHRCKPQTRGFMAGNLVQRCACGATHLLGGWVHKNETRKMRARR